MGYGDGRYLIGLRGLVDKLSAQKMLPVHGSFYEYSENLNKSKLSNTFKGKY